MISPYSETRLVDACLDSEGLFTMPAVKRLLPLLWAFALLLLAKETVSPEI